MQVTNTLKAPNDRTLNRLIVGMILILVIGIPLVGVIYFMDRYVDPGPSLVDRRLQQLEEAVRKSPNVVSLRLQLAGAYSVAKRLDDAIGQYDAVLKVAPDNKTAHLGKANALRDEGNLDAAAKDYQAIVDAMQGKEFAPEDTELQSAFYNLGAIALQEKRPQDAVSFLAESLKINRTDADSLNLIGTAYLAIGKAQEAATALRSAVEFVPVGWCEPYASLTRAYGTLGEAAEAQWAGAMLDFCKGKATQAQQKLTALVNGDAAAEALVGLGMIAESSSDRTAAADYYRQAVARDPKDFNAVSGLSRVTDPASTPLPSTPPGSSARPAGGNG